MHWIADRQGPLVLVAILVFCAGLAIGVTTAAGLAVAATGLIAGIVAVNVQAF